MKASGHTDCNNRILCYLNYFNVGNGLLVLYDDGIR